MRSADSRDGAGKSTPVAVSSRIFRVVGRGPSDCSAISEILNVRLRASISILPTLPSAARSAANAPFASGWAWSARLWLPTPARRARAKAKPVTILRMGLLLAPTPPDHEEIDSSLGGLQ